MKFVLTPLAAAVIGSLAVYGCGSGSEAPPPDPTATVVAPVVNTPLKDVTVTLTCADGTLGGTGTAVNGSVSIVVQLKCPTPYTMTVSGKGTMAGPDLVFGTADDEAYDSTTRTALKSIIQTGDLSAAMTSGATVTAPSITALTTMVAETVAKANPTTAEVDAAKATVAGVTGVAATDLYKNPLTNSNVLKAATLVNELVASGIKADPTQTPSGLVKAMAANTTAKLSDATLNPAALLGLSTANAAIVQAQTSTIQAKAGAMKSVADAVTANVAVADQAALTPADAGRALAAAVAGTQGSDAATAIAKAKLSQDTMKQMGVEMDALRKDTTVAATDLPAKMAAVVKGLETVRIDQDAGIQASIVAAGGDATKIATVVTQASGMVIGAAPALLTTVTGATVTNLQTSGYVEGAAASIISKIDPTKIAAAVTAAGGDASKIDFTTVMVAGADPTKIGSDAATTGAAASSLALTAPTALASYPALASQVVGMVINRATSTGQLASANLQAWVNAVGTALAANSPTLLNPESVGEAFETLNPNLAAVPGTLTMTLVADPVFMQSMTPITTTPTTTAAATTTTAAATSTTAAATSTTAAATSTTAATTSTTAATTSTTAATTSTTAATTSTTAATTSTTAVVVVTSTTATTTSTTTSTTAPTYPSLSLGVVTPTGTFADEKTGLGVLAAGAANYTGGVITFGPYTVTGLSAATTMGSTGAVSAYTKFSVNGGALVSSGSVSNGDTITVQFDLPTYWSDAGPFGFSQTFNPRIRQTTATTIFQSFNAKLCSDPATPPETGNSQCK